MTRPREDPIVEQALSAMAAARQLKKDERRLESFPVEGLLDEAGERAVWRLQDACEAASPALLSLFASEDELTSALVAEPDRDGTARSPRRIADAIAGEQARSPTQVVTVTLANARLEQGFVAIGDDLALVTTWDPEVEGHSLSAATWPDDPGTRLERHLGPSAYRGFRRDRDDETGREIDTRTLTAMVSREDGSPGRARARAEVRARYAIAAWSLLAPPPDDPSVGEMWPTLAKWTPAAHTRHVPAVGVELPVGARSAARRSSGASYLYPPWTLPAGETLLTPFAAMRAAADGGHYAGALLTAARALYLAEEPTNGLSPVERLVQVRVAQEALAERRPDRPKGGGFRLCSERLGVRDRLNDAYGSDAVDRAIERATQWRNHALHRAHGFQLHWGAPARKAAAGVAGSLTPPVARRDLTISLTITATVTAAVWWIAHDAEFDDALIGPVFEP